MVHGGIGGGKGRARIIRLHDAVQQLAANGVSPE